MEGIEPLAGQWLGARTDMPLLLSGETASSAARPSPSPRLQGEVKTSAKRNRPNRAFAFRSMAMGVLALGILLLAASLPARAQQGRALPPGEGRDLVAVACSQCHGLNLIMAMRDGPAGWRRFVTNMVARGAQLNEREADTAIAYLAANFGPTAPSAATVAAADKLPAGPGKELVATRCTLCHDLERIADTKRGKTEWPVLVANMMGRGAPVSADEAKTIASYLAANFGREQ